MCRSNQKMILIIMIFGQDTPRLVVPPFYEMNLEYCGQVRRFSGIREEILQFVPLSGSQEHLLFLRCDPQFLRTLIRIHPKKDGCYRQYPDQYNFSTQQFLNYCKRTFHPPTPGTL